MRLRTSTRVVPSVTDATLAHRTSTQISTLTSSVHITSRPLPAGVAPAVRRSRKNVWAVEFAWRESRSRVKTLFTSRVSRAGLLRQLRDTTYHSLYIRRLRTIAFILRALLHRPTRHTLYIRRANGATPAPVQEVRGCAEQPSACPCRRHYARRNNDDGCRSLDQC